MNVSWNVGNASMTDAQRFAGLATTEGGHYLDDLWALVEFALDERVRTFAYGQATESNSTWVSTPCRNPRNE